MSIEMSMLENKTGQLFRAFMPRKKEILNVKNKEVLDIRIYTKEYYQKFNPANTFTKWAAVEVPNFDQVPDGMKTIIIESGKYAVFTYKSAEANQGIFQYIFTQWLPNSEYRLDDRPHFDILGEKTQQRNPNAEEEIWVPVRLKE